MAASQATSDAGREEVVWHPDHGRPALLSRNQHSRCAVAAGIFTEVLHVSPRTAENQAFQGGGGSLRRQSLPLHPSIRTGICACGPLSNTVASYCPASSGAWTHTPKPDRLCQSSPRGSPQDWEAQLLAPAEEPGVGMEFWERHLPAPDWDGHCCRVRVPQGGVVHVCVCVRARMAGVGESTCAHASRGLGQAALR